MKRAWSRKNLWEATPAVVKASLGRILGLVPLPWLLGSQFRSCSRFLADAQWWDEERIHAHQVRCLRRVLTLASNTPYYRRTFREVGFEPGDFKDLPDLLGLPMIDKSIVRDHLQEMLTMPVDSPSVDYMTTSGTCGTPLAFYIDRNRSATEFAHLAACWGRVGYRPGMRMSVLRGNMIEADPAGLHHRHDPLLRQHIYSSFHLTDEQMARYVRHMHLTRPRFLHAYPSSAATLARFMRAYDMQFPKELQAILLESEPLYPYQRELITRNFPVRMYASYGHTEKLVLAGECEHSDQYHVWPTYGYCEILDATGKPVDAGAQGEIVGTGFINSVVPFIRYRTNDYATYAGTGCSACGRKHMLFDKVLGRRAQEYLVTADGRAIVAWAVLNMHDETFDGIAQFQFTQDKPGEAILNMVPTSGGRRYDLPRIQRHLDRKLDGQIRVRLQICEAIERNASGKRSIVRQRVQGVEQLAPTAGDGNGESVTQTSM